RIDPNAFDLPVEAIRRGHYTDKYFVRAREVLAANELSPNVTMQVFQKHRALLAGTDEAIALLKLCLTESFSWSDLEVLSLHDGDTIDPHETVMWISGPYRAFAHLETLYLGILGRRTLVATLTEETVAAAAPKPVLFFPARHDLWSAQAGDGWAARVGGVTSVSTDAQGTLWGAEGIGTVPHALIAAYSGDTVKATEALANHVPSDVPVISLVDFDNDSVGTALAVARSLGSRLHGVRLDTPETLVDRSLSDPEERGVTAGLVHAVRTALDREGFQHVRIMASGGFTAEKIRAFEEASVPVDSYGVGSSLLRGSYDFTADVVLLEGQPAAKAGRSARPNPRLQRVD
ncbi:MAG: nicotinate phosphoribosyltransferase, partial [Longimicrobiales bacterium]